jgi:hypothetical protein
VQSTRREGELAIQAAVDAQETAEREAQIADATVARLAADLEAAKHKAGVQVPADEILFVRTLPVRVEQIDAMVGDMARGPVMKVTNNQLAIDASLRIDEAPLVKPGMTVAIDEQALGIKATGVVQWLGASPGTHGLDNYHIYCEIRVDETPTPLAGFSLRLTIPVKSTGGAVTAVPVSALALAADGTSRVQVENSGQRRFVVVEPGLSADGFVAVTPVDASLEPGELVVVGYDKK